VISLNTEGLKSSTSIHTYHYLRNPNNRKIDGFSRNSNCLGEFIWFRLVFTFCRCLCTILLWWYLYYWVCTFFFLQAEVAKVVETQTGLERQLELIETHQREVCVSAKFLYVSFTLIDCSFILRSVLLFLSLFL